MNYECCKNCVPPKRHPGCQANCKDHKKAAIINELERRWKERERRRDKVNTSPALREMERRRMLKKK